MDVVGVVGGDRWDAEVLAQAEQAFAHPLLDVDPVVHQLEEVVVLAEDRLEVAGRLAGLVVVTDAQPGLDLARGAPGGGDQALGVLGEELAVGPGLVVEALHRRARGEPEQVVHALGALGEQGHVGVGARAGDVVVPTVVPADPLLVEARGVGGEVGLHADDRLDAVGPAPWTRSRRHRRRCRGRSSRWCPCPARRSGRTCHRAGRPRRAWSTRCGRAGGRIRPGRRSCPTWSAISPSRRSGGHGSLGPG